jgi:hypothetical protein
LRWTLLALSAYGLLWVVALAFSLRQHPHLVGSDGLVVRFGHFWATRIPLDELISARQNVRVDHRRNIELAAGVASFSVAGETNVEAFFAPDVLVEVRGRFAQVSRVRFFADDPSAAVRLLLDRGLVSGRGNVVS